MKYTVPLLREWRQKAEDAARKEVESSQSPRIAQSFCIATHIGSHEIINPMDCERHGRPVVPLWLLTNPQRMSSDWLVDRLASNADLRLYFDPKWCGGTWFVADVAAGDGVLINLDQLTDLKPPSPTTTTTTTPSPAMRDAHLICFGVDDWKVWREQGNLASDSLVCHSEWRRGDFRYSCTVRLRNDMEWQDQIHRFGAEFRKGDVSLFRDTYVLDNETVVLPPRKWVSLNIDHGLRDRSIAETADSVWLVAEGVGDNVRFEWLLAKLAVKMDDLEEE